MEVSQCHLSDLPETSLRNKSQDPTISSVINTKINNPEDHKHGLGPP